MACSRVQIHPTLCRSSSSQARNNPGSCPRCRQRVRFRFHLLEKQFRLFHQLSLLSSPARQHRQPPSLGFTVCRCQPLSSQWLFQHRWCKDFAKDVGMALLGRRLVSPGSMGRCAFTHIIQPLDCPGGRLGRTASFSSSSRRSWWLSRRQCRPSPLSLRKRSRRVR